MAEIEGIASDVVDAAVKLHRRLGPGLLESVYEALLAQELGRRGHIVERQRELDFEFDGLLFKGSLRPDLLIERAVVVELKSSRALTPVDSKQVLTYLRLLNLRLGILLNFGAPTMKAGLRRIVNGHFPSPSWLRVIE